MGIETPLPKFAEGDVLYAKDLQLISDTVAGMTNSPRGQLTNGIAIGGMRFTAGIRESIYNIQFLNAGSEIPAYGVVRAVGWDTNRSILTVGQPNTYGSQWRHIINGPQPVSASEFGVATNLFPCDALYDDADGTPQAGESWGPRNGTYKLRKNTGGFTVLGVSDSTNKLVRVMRAPMLACIGYRTSALTVGNGADFTVVAGGSKGTEFDTSQTVAGFVRRGIALPNVRYPLDWIDSIGNSGFEVRGSLEIIAKTTSAISKGSNGTADVYGRTWDVAAVLSGVSIAVFSRGISVSSGKWIIARWFEPNYPDDKFWELIGEC